MFAAPGGSGTSGRKIPWAAPSWSPFQNCGLNSATFERRCTPDPLESSSSHHHALPTDHPHPTPPSPNFDSSSRVDFSEQIPLVSEYPAAILDLVPRHTPSQWLVIFLSAGIARLFPPELPRAPPYRTACGGFTLPCRTRLSEALRTRCQHWSLRLIVISQCARATAARTTDEAEQEQIADIEIVASQSSPRPSSPVNGAGAAASGASVARPSSPTPPGGPRTAIRRRAAADQKEKIANARPNSTRAAGAGGSSSTMLSTFPPP